MDLQFQLLLGATGSNLIQFLTDPATAGEPGSTSFTLSGTSGSGKKGAAAAVVPSVGLMLGAWVLVSGMAGAGLILL